jgi:hypothetical protein
LARAIADHYRVRHDLEIRILTTDGELLRELTLVPTQDHRRPTPT